MNIEIGESHASFELQHLGVTYLAGGKYMYPSPIMKLFELARVVSRRVLIPRDSTQPFMFFVRWQQAEFTEGFRDIVSKASSYRQAVLTILKKKLKILHVFNSVGNSSASYNDIITDLENGNALVFGSGLYVNIDPVTRRPAPISETVKKSINSIDTREMINYKKKISDQCTTRYNIPSDATTYTRSCSVSTRQMDQNNHTNQSAYVEFCFDCLAQAVAEDFCASMKTSIWKYPLRRYSVLHIRESKFPDKIDTVVWQDKSNLWLFHFHVMKEGNVICQVQLEFYESFNSAKL